MDWRDSQSKYSVTSAVGEEPSTKLRTPKKKQYRPIPTGPPFLISVLCAILAYIALVEVTLHEGTKTVPSNANVKARAKGILPRQDSGSISLCTEYATQTAYETTTIYITTTAGAVRRSLGYGRRQESPESTTTITTDGTVTTATYTFMFTTAPAAYGSITTPTTTATAYGSTTVPTTAATAYGSILAACQSTTTLFTTVTLQVTAYGSSTSPSVTTETEMATINAYGSVTEPPPPPSAAPTAYGSLTSPAQSEITTTTTAHRSLTTVALVPTTSIHHSLTKSVSQYTTLTTSSASINQYPPPLGTTPYTSFGISPTPASSSSLVPTEVIALSEVIETVYSTSFVVYTTSSVRTAEADKTSTSAYTSPTSAADSLTQSELRIGDRFTMLDYFNAMYLPTLLAVILKSIWVVVFASTKLVEPFHQLSNSKGATAEDTLFADYLSTGLSLSSVRAVFQGRWVMALTTGVYVILAIVPSLASESMTVRFLAKCERKHFGTFPCAPAWMVDVLVIRAIETLLGVMATLVVVLVTLQWKRENGVMSDPSSIASMASLLHHPDVLADLQEIDTMTKTSELSSLLAGNQYILGTYSSSSGHYRYGLIKTVGTVRLNRTAAFSATRYHTVSNPSNNEIKSSARSIPWGAIRDAALGLCLLGLLGVCVGEYLDGHSDPFNNFFTSDSFGPRFVLVVAATIVDYQWKSIEREVRIMEPFRRLGQRMASPRTTILSSRTGTPYSALPIALWNMNFFNAAIAAVAILSDVLIIAISGVPFSPAQIRPAALASFYVSFGILGIMLIALAAVLFWRRRSPVMPRQPDTLASVWTYLCASKMLDDLEGMEFMTDAVRNKIIQEAGRRYFYGRATGSDGKDRYMVDQEGSGGTVFY